MHLLRFYTIRGGTHFQQHLYVFAFDTIKRLTPLHKPIKRLPPTQVSRSPCLSFSSDISIPKKNQPLISIQPFLLNSIVKTFWPLHGEWLCNTAKGRKKAREKKNEQRAEGKEGRNKSTGYIEFGKIQDWRNEKERETTEQNRTGMWELPHLARHHMTRWQGDILFKSVTLHLNVQIWCWPF